MSEGEGFQIRDRRRVNLEGKLKDEYDEKIKPEPGKKLLEPETQPFPTMKLDFVSFLINFSAMAYDALGLGSTSKGINPEDAKYIIDAVGILEKKTGGNPTCKGE